MKKSSSGFSSIIFLVSILFVVSIGGYSLWKKGIFEDFTICPKNQVSIGNGECRGTGVIPREPTSDLATNWVTYNLDNVAQFQYPLSWKIVDTVPVSWLSKEVIADKPYLKCGGPIFQSSENSSTAIIVGMRSATSDGPMCTSKGKFSKIGTRTVTTLDPQKEITIMHWSDVNAQWQGHLIQSHQFFSSSESLEKPVVTFILVYLDGKDSIAEITFDKVLSTFKFID